MKAMHYKYKEIMQEVITGQRFFALLNIIF